MQPKELRSSSKANNIVRLHQMLLDLADTNAIIRGLSVWDLTVAFNKRYGSETRRVSDTTLRVYIHNGIAAGWLTLEHENDIRGRLVFTLIAADEQDDTT